MAARNKISFLQATSNISRGDPIFIDSDKPYLYVDKVGRPIGFCLKPEDVKLTYIDWYIHKLAQETIHSPFMIFDMAKQIKCRYIKHNYENVIKQCLILKRLSKMSWSADHWRYAKYLMNPSVSSKSLENLVRKWNRLRLLNKFKIWRYLA